MKQTINKIFYNLCNYISIKNKYKMEKLKYVRLTENAYHPYKASLNAAGFDLYSAYDYQVQPNGKVLVMTDIQISVPYGCYGRIAPRSSLALKNFIDVGGDDFFLIYCKILN